MWAYSLTVITDLNELIKGCRYLLDWQPANPVPANINNGFPFHQLALQKGKILPSPAHIERKRIKMALQLPRFLAGTRTHNGYLKG